MVKKSYKQAGPSIRYERVQRNLHNLELLQQSASNSSSGVYIPQKLEVGKIFKKREGKKES